MATVILNPAELTRAGRKNVPLRKALEHWLRTAEEATWRNLRDVRRTFPSADGVTVMGGEIQTVATVFNIKGNQYRLITTINYAGATVLIRELLTHAEYSKGAWKDRL